MTGNAVEWSPPQALKLEHLALHPALDPPSCEICNMFPVLTFLVCGKRSDWNLPCGVDAKIKQGISCKMLDWSLTHGKHLMEVWLWHGFHTWIHPLPDATMHSTNTCWASLYAEHLSLVKGAQRLTRHGAYSTGASSCSVKLWLRSWYRSWRVPWSILFHQIAKFPFLHVLATNGASEKFHLSFWNLNHAQFHKQPQVFAHFKIDD